MLFPTYNPAQQAFNWYCRSNNITEANATSAASGMRPHVSRIRNLYRSPIGHAIPYDDQDFRDAYLLAYFP